MTAHEANVSKSFFLCTESNFKMKSWKKPDDLEKAREVQLRKFQATLDSLIEEFEIRIQNIKTQRVRFRVHYVTHSPRQVVAVTWNQHNFRVWKSFVLTLLWILVLQWASSWSGNSYRWRMERWCAGRSVGIGGWRSPEKWKMKRSSVTAHGHITELLR